MDSPFQDDPYLSLGVTKDATPAEIKASYRKLVLKSHPDKFPDEALKKQKADEFHKIQQAYELLQDEQQRSRYDARVRLAELQAEIMRREGVRGAGSRSYDVRPPPSSHSSYPGTAQFEIRTPKFTEDYTPEPRASTTRKHSDTSAYFHRTAPPTPRQEEKRRSEKEDKARSERRRARDADIRDSRDRKYYSSTENVNDRNNFEEGRKRRDDFVKQREDDLRREQREEDLRREQRRRYEAYADESPRRYTETRQRDAYDVPSSRSSVDVPKYSQLSEDARKYQENANLSSSRPKPVRTGSSGYYEVRRSRAKADDSRRRSPDGVAPPNLGRAATTSRWEHLRDMVGDGSLRGRSYSHDVTAETQHASPPPPRRADTSPNVHNIKESSSRRTEPRSSKLRPDPPDSGYSSSSPVTPDAYPTVPNITTTSAPRTYRYTPADYVTASPDKYTPPSGFDNIETRVPKAERERERERESRRTREPSIELPRPPIGATARPAPAPTSAQYSSRDEQARRPSYSHRSPDLERERDRERAERRDRDSRRERDGERDRRDGERRDERRRERDSRESERKPEMLWGEVPSPFSKERNMRSKDYRRERTYDPREKEYARPSFARSNTINVFS